jgi:hypothetical protein
MSAGVGGLAIWKGMCMKRMVKPVEESATRGPMQDQVPHVRVRCKEEFSADELALLQTKLEGWIRAVATKSDSKRPRHQFVMKSKNTGRV